MSLFRHKHRENILAQLDPDLQHNNRSEVIDTIDSLQLPREKIILVGSGVLTALGMPRHAHDIDLVVHPSILENLQESGTLPNGVRIHPTTASRPEHLHFQAGTTPLPSEFLSYHTSPYANSYEEMWKHIEVVDSEIGDIAILSPYELWRRKCSHVRIGDDREIKLAQDNYDRNLLEYYFAQQEYPIR